MYIEENNVLKYSYYLKKKEDVKIEIITIRETSYDNREEQFNSVYYFLLFEDRP